MKLKNKSTGQVEDFNISGVTKHMIQLRHPKHDSLICAYASLNDMLNVWEIIDE